MKWKPYLPALGAVIVSAVVLAIAAYAFENLRAIRAEEELQTKLRAMLPGSTVFTRRDGDGGAVQALYEGSTGTVAQVTCPGYVYDITALVAVDDRGRVVGLTVRDGHETLGLGSDMLTDYRFLSQFLRTTGQTQVEENIVPISGATVTSRAVSRCVNLAVSAITGVDVPSQATPWEDGT